MATAEDRLSALPDCLLLDEMLPKISFRDVIRCSRLSRRWRFLWRETLHLKFCCHDFENLKDREIRVIINNALQNHSGPLHSFQLQIAMYVTRTQNWVHNWVHLAALKHVKRITLEIIDRNPRSGKILRLHLGDSIFKCENLTAINVKYCALSKILTNFVGFKSLKTCYMYYVNCLNDTVLPWLMESCPNLQNLGIHGCYGLTNIKICAPNLRYLDLGYLSSIASLKVICPQLTEIRLEQSHGTDGLHLLKGVSRSQSVKKITLLNYGGVGGFSTDIPGFAVLDRLPRLQELTIHGRCFQEKISVNKAPEGVTLPNLKKVIVHIGPQMNERELTLLSSLLRICPSNAMRVFLPPNCSNIIQNKLHDLKKKFPEVKIYTAKIIWNREVCPICDTSPEKFSTYII